MHLQGDPGLRNLSLDKGCSYADSKLHVLLLSMAVARKWTDVYSNTVDPGWVPTKMGGAYAPDNLQKGFETQSWLAVSNDNEAKVSGRYFHHKKESHYLPGASDVDVQEKFLTLCKQVTGVRFLQVIDASRNAQLTKFDQTESKLKGSVLMRLPVKS